MPKKKTAAPTESPARTTKGDRTRAAILLAATKLFAARGYDATGVRDIAEAVGINPALINLYFGSKAELFRRVVADSLGHGEMMAGDLGELAHQWADFTVNGVKLDRARLQASTRALQLLMRSAVSEIATETVRETINDQIVERIAERLSGPGVQERAALIATYLLGFSMMQRVVGVRGLTPGDQDLHVHYLTRAIQDCIDGTSGAR